MSFCILYNVFQKITVNNIFPAVWRGARELFKLSLSQNFHFGTDVTFQCTDIILKLM